MNEKSVKVKGKEVELNVDRNLFVKMAIIAQHRKVDMREDMSFVQKYSANNKTFQEVSKDLLNRFLSK